MPGVSELARQASEAEEQRFGKTGTHCAACGAGYPLHCHSWCSTNAVIPAFGIGHNGGPPLDDVATRSGQYAALSATRNSFSGPYPKTAVVVPAEIVNPKDLAGAKKPATWSVMPRWVVLLVGRVMSVGAAKYGAFNYRESRISASVYQDALERHLSLWFDGEDEDAESGVSHLAHAIACCSLLLDAQESGKLHDDRQKTGSVRKHLDRLEMLLTTLPLPKPFVA